MTRMLVLALLLACATTLFSQTAQPPGEGRVVVNPAAKRELDALNLNRAVPGEAGAETENRSPSLPPSASGVDGGREAAEKAHRARQVIREGTRRTRSRDYMLAGAIAAGAVLCLVVGLVVRRGRR